MAIVATASATACEASGCRPSRIDRPAGIARKAGCRLISAGRATTARGQGQFCGVDHQRPQLHPSVRVGVPRRHEGCRDTQDCGSNEEQRGPGFGRSGQAERKGHSGDPGPDIARDHAYRHAVRLHRQRPGKNGPKRGNAENQEGPSAGAEYRTRRCWRHWTYCLLLKGTLPIHCRCRRHWRQGSKRAHATFPNTNLTFVAPAPH